jgi:nickel transport protein
MDEGAPFPEAQDHTLAAEWIWRPFPPSEDPLLRGVVMLRHFLVMLFLLVTASGAEAHSVEYQVENRGISARFFFLPNDPANYSPYEILGPGDEIPHQKGRTDKNGVVSFLPDRSGKWRIKVIAESEHGGHAATVEIDVKEGLLMEFFSKPLVATHVKFFVGAGLLLSVFGMWALWTARRRKAESISGGMAVPPVNFE